MRKRTHLILTIVLSFILVLALGVAVYAGTSTKVPADGLYKVTVPDPSPMCKILAEDNNTCNLLVKDGKMTAVFRLNSDGYDKVYVGTKEEAAAADKAEWIYRTEEKRTTVDEGIEVTRTICSYEVPVSALGTEISIAAHSISKGETDGPNYVKGWYDRTFTFSDPRALTEAEAADIFTRMLTLTSEKTELQDRYDSLQQKYNEAETNVANLNARIKVMETKVSGVKATAYSSSHKITVKWTKNSKVTDYNVYRATSLNGTYQSVKKTTSNTATINNHKKGKTYYYKVVGYKKVAGSTVYTKDSAIIAVKAK